MRVFYAGFNLYGQVVNCKDFIVKGFADVDYESLKDITFNHSYSVFRNDKGVFIHGAVGKTTHDIQKIDCDEKAIRLINCFDNRILFLNNDGSIFKTDIDKSLEMARIPNFLNVENADGGKDRIVTVACGKCIIVALSNSGKLFNVPNKLDFENKDIIQIAVGREHALLLDGHGNVYSFGVGSRGQLGHGTLNNEHEPKQIEALAGIKIAKICAGSWHSCALSHSGDLYTWGWNSNGQLGLFNDKPCENVAVSVMATPEAVAFDEFNESNVMYVACGSRHTVVLLDNKKLYGMGWNKYNQLGDRHDENVYKMSFLKDFCDQDVKDVKCGPWSTAVLINF